MSIARHHAECFSLAEISGPFLSMPMRLAAFPQGLDAHDREHAPQLRVVYDEWADNQGGLAPEMAIHRAWLHFMRAQTLAWLNDLLAEEKRPLTEDGKHGSLPAKIALADGRVLLPSANRPVML